MTRQIIRLMDDYDFFEQFCDPYVCDVNCFMVDNHIYKVGDLWNGRKIVGAFVHPESDCAWFIAEGFFEVAFDNYKEAGV